MAMVNKLFTINTENWYLPVNNKETNTNQPTICGGQLIPSGKGYICDRCDADSGPMSRWEAADMDYVCWAVPPTVDSEPTMCRGSIVPDNGGYFMCNRCDDRGIIPLEAKEMGYLCTSTKKTKNSMKNKIVEPTKKINEKFLAKAEKLKKGTGLKVNGYISGMHSKLNDEFATITIEVGGLKKESQRFNIRVPEAMAQGLMSKNVDIILAIKD